MSFVHWESYMFIVKLKKLPYDAFFSAVCCGVFFIFLFLYIFECIIELPSAVIIHTHSQKNRSLANGKTNDASFYVFYHDDALDNNTTRPKNIKKKEKKIIVKSDRPGLSDGDIEELYRFHFTHKKNASNCEEKIMLVEMPEKKKKIIPKKDKRTKKKEKKIVPEVTVQKKVDKAINPQKKQSNDANNKIKQANDFQVGKMLSVNQNKNIVTVGIEKAITDAVYKNTQEITEKVFNGENIVYSIPIQKNMPERNVNVVYTSTPVVFEEKSRNQGSDNFIDTNTSLNSNDNNTYSGNDSNDSYSAAYQETSQRQSTESAFENSSEYHDFLSRLKRGLEQFPGKKQHCLITLKIKSYAINSVIVAAQDKNITIASAYRAHIISLIKRLPLPYVLFENKVITIEV